jgi:hypothetical protein
MNQFAVVRLQRTPLDVMKTIMNMKLTILDDVSSSTVMPMKYPYPQKTKLDKHPKAVNHPSYSQVVTMPIKLNNTMIIMSGYINDTNRLLKNLPRK